MSRRVKKLIKKIMGIIGEIPTAVAVIIIAVFDGLGVAYFVNCSSYTSKFSMLKHYFPGTKIIWLFLGIVGWAIAMQLFSIAFERLLGKLRDRRAERRGSTK